MYLGIETSSAVSSIALADEHSFVGELTVSAGLTHSEQLVPHIEGLMKQCNITPADIAGIAVSIGPGSFTGLRIGMGTAKAMAYALNIPLVGIMTMDALAYNFYNSQHRIGILIDAQKKNVYEARYHWEEEQLICDQLPQVRARSEVIEELSQGTDITMVAGDGAVKAATAIEEAGGSIALAPLLLRMPKASSLLMAAIPHFTAGDTTDAMTLLPYYIRRSEAEVLWEKKHPDAARNEETPSVIVTDAVKEEP